MLHRITILIMVLFAVSCGNDNILKEVKEIGDYPSASGIEYTDKKFFIIGDDANSLLILDSSFRTLDSIQLYSFKEKRIPKAVKSDLESILLTWDKKLLMVGSGSLEPYRNRAWLINPSSGQKDSVRLDAFYQRLKENGIKELNIEGAVSIPGSIILSNRGNKGYPKNQLIITSTSFWEKQLHAPISIIPIGSNPDSAVFNGVSGLAYSEKSDKLILTVSTEDTRSVTEDGAIGKSYLWIVHSFSSKRNWKAINPNEVIELDKIDSRFKGQKIESVCLTGESKRFLYLVLVADNDNGSSTVFRMLVENK